MRRRTLTILKIWKNDYPWDVRVEKIMRTLKEAGHEVHLICRNLKGLTVYENIDGIQIHRFVPTRSKLLNSLYSGPFFLNPFWIYKTYRVMRNVRADVILVRDLPLAPLALVLGRILNTPVIYDMAENYPAMWNELSGLLQRMIKNPRIASIVEDFVIKHVDRILVVVEESRDRLLNKGISPDKITVVSNTPDTNIVPNLPLENPGLPSGRFILLYVGYVNRFRGLDTVIKSLVRLKSSIPDILFVVVGDGAYLQHLKKLADDLRLTENVLFTGWVRFDKVPLFISYSDLCVVPHYATEHKNTTIPNKLFDYMVYRKAIVVSDAVPLKRIVQEVGCGEVFQSGNVDSFVEVTEKLWPRPDLRKAMGEKGYQAIKKKYGWEYDSARLISAINSVGQRP
jgi:glycosyltransferase involved in cell wall biosynthesis